MNISKLGEKTWLFLPLAGGSVARVDVADWHLVKDYSWSEAAGGKGAIAVRTPKPARTYVLLHRLVLGVDDTRLVVRARNGDIYDCRRENLEVVTRGQVAAETPHTPRGAQFVGGWVWRNISRGGRDWRYAMVTYRGRKIYCKTEAEALERLQWLRAKDPAGRGAAERGRVNLEAEAMDFEGLAQCSHVFAGCGRVAA